MTLRFSIRRRDNHALGVTLGRYISALSVAASQVHSFILTAAFWFFVMRISYLIGAKLQQSCKLEKLVNHSPAARFLQSFSRVLPTSRVGVSHR